MNTHAIDKFQLHLLHSWILFHNHNFKWMLEKVLLMQLLVLDRDRPTDQSTASLRYQAAI